MSRRSVWVVGLLLATLMADPSLIFPVVVALLLGWEALP